MIWREETLTCAHFPFLFVVFPATPMLKTTKAHFVVSCAWEKLLQGSSEPVASGWRQSSFLGSLTHGFFFFFFNGKELRFNILHTPTTCLPAGMVLGMFSLVVVFQGALCHPPKTPTLAPPWRSQSPSCPSSLSFCFSILLRCNKSGWIRPVSVQLLYFLS